VPEAPGSRSGAPAPPLRGHQQRGATHPPFPFQPQAEEACQGERRGMGVRGEPSGWTRARVRRDVSEEEV